MTELIPTPTAEKSDPTERAAEAKRPVTPQPVALLSPPAVPFSPSQSVTNSLRVSKRPSFYGRALGSIRASFGRFSSTHVREQHTIIHQKCQREYGASVASHAFDTSFDGLIDWIKSERMTRLPHKGGSWDRVLIAAQHFAEQVFHFNRHIEFFTEGSGAATNLVFGQCLVLLELGHENALALEKAFNLFYQFGLELSPLLRRGDLFVESHSIMEGLGQAFAELLQIVTGVSITFYQAVHSGRAFTKIDIFSSFSSLIESFRARVRRCAHEMWNASLVSHNMDGCRIEFLQKWLAPKDHVLAFLASNHIRLASRPEQFTCTWFQPHLSSFLKNHDSIMFVEGQAGSGKTTLANWALDRLHRPIGRKHVSTINFFFDSNVAAQSTPSAMLRTLLNQLLWLRIGDVHIFDAVNEAFSQSKTTLSVEDQEAKLWHALSGALHAINNEEDDTLVIVVDGISESDSNMQRICTKLYELAQKHAAVRLIQFSQPLNHSPTASTHVKLSIQNIFDDLRTVVRRKLHAHDHFRDRDVGDQENIIEQIATAANGSMLWAYLACKLIQRQHSCNEFDVTLKSLLNGPKSVDDVVKRLFASVHLDADCKDLLSLLITAERPLQSSEVEALLCAEPENQVFNDRAINLQSLLSHLSALTIVGEGLITLRHSSIREAILRFATDSSFAQHLKNRQQAMVMRLLIYSKACLLGDHEPTFTCIDVHQADNRLQAHSLGQYAVRYWAVHLSKSPLYKAKGELQLPKEFNKRIFPSSVMFCLLEQACWTDYSPREAIDLHHVAFRVRKAIFGQEHACVLQSALFCAIISETVLSRHLEAIEWYALAAKISKAVIGVHADLTVTCCEILLRISESSITKKRTAVMTYREEVFLILISSFKHRYGSSSKQVLEIYKKLQELYIYIGEETKAHEILVIIQKLTVTIFGGHSDEAQSMSRHAQVVLKKHEHVTEIQTRNGFLFGGYTEEVEEVLTLVKVEIIIKLAAECVIRGEITRAEELYIELWLKLSEHCHTVHICEWHEKKIQVMLIYARFLQTHKRITECSAILLAVWTEYEHYEFSMFESVVILLKEIAVCMKAVELFTMALVVFKKCWSFFKHQHKEETIIFKEIEKYISETSIEIVRKTTEKKITTTSETVIREVFESSFTSSETTITSTTVELCKSLTSIYLKEERWSEAITCIKKTLARSWSTFFSESIESILMAEHFSAESIELVISLAECYIHQRKYERAEEIYIRLYRAHRKHCKIEDIAVINYSEILIAFYTKHELFTKAISFYQELLVDYRAYYGKTHSMTVKILYALGALCRRHSTNYGYWLEYYLEIVVNLNKGAVICHEEAFEALIIVAEHYYETLRFSESLVYFKSIFATFCKHGLKYKYFEKIEKVHILIEHYYRSVEESKVEISEYISILKELHIACVKFYGESSTISVSVTVVLAEVCCRSEKHQFEAISYYELIMKHSSTVSKETVKRTQTTLKTLYIKQITSTSTSTTVTTETITRATTLIYQQYLEIRKEYSCTHELVLSHLKELVMLYYKQSKLELAIKELTSIVVECITKVSSAKELIEAAITIAAIYTSCGIVVSGIELIRELKLQIIYKITEKCSHFGFNVTTVGRACFAFIAAFEYHLRAIYTVTFAMYMSDLVAEYLFYERFTQYIKVKAQVEQVVICAGRLRQILRRTHRVVDFDIIERKVIDYFFTFETAVVKTSSKTSIKVFVGILLAYFSNHTHFKSWTAAAGHAAVTDIRILLNGHQHREAYELGMCTYKFLMAHQGLDDSTEITLGFQLCLMMAGRNKATNNAKPKDAALARAMMELSKEILDEVFSICKKDEFDIAACQLSELNELIMLIGEQKDYKRLVWLLELLWKSREGQTRWPVDTTLYLGKRLVQAQFEAGNRTAAIRLCENIVYNVRRVHGLRHYHTLSFHALLASMYTSLALKYKDEAANESNKNKKHSEEMARVHFRKAVQVHEEVLKLIVMTDEDISDCDSDDEEYTDVESANGNASAGFAWVSKDQELLYVRAHIRRLQLALQRYGGWLKSVDDYERLTSKVWGCYGKEQGFKLVQEQVLASKWKMNGFGNGKAEGDVKEDGFRLPEAWWVIKPEGLTI